MDHNLEKKRRITLEGGEVIFKQGDNATEMYVIYSGKVRVYRDQDGRETELATLGPDDFLGEMALFDNRPRSASAKAVEPSELRVITRETFEAMPCDPVIRQLMASLTQRLRAMDDAFEKLSVESDSRREFMSSRLTQNSWLT